MNQTFKDPNARSIGVLTHIITSNPETRVIQNNAYGMPPLSNSRFVTTNTVSENRPLQSFGGLNQARFVTPQWRGDASKVFDTKHSSHSIIEQSYQKNQADRPSGMQFDYQKEYEKLLVKYRRKEEKNRRHIKDLSNQIIVKDSIINNFEMEISSYKAPDSQRLQTEFDHLSKIYEQVSRELNQFKLKVSSLEQDKRKCETEHSLGVTALTASATSIKDKQILTLRKRVDELQRLSASATNSNDKSAKDKDYYFGRVSETERQLKLSESKIEQLQNDVARMTRQLHSNKQEIELLTSRFSERTDETRGNFQKLLHLRDVRLKQYENEALRRMNQISELKSQVESIPSQLSSKIDELRAEYERKLQAKDIKLFQTDSDRIKASRINNEAKMQIETMTSQMTQKSEQFQRLIRMKEEKIEQLEKEIVNLNNQCYELKNNSKVIKELQIKDSKIAQLQTESSKIVWQLNENKKQMDGVTRQFKLNEEHLRQTHQRQLQSKDLRIEALQREVEAKSKQAADVKSQLQSIILQQSKRAEQSKQDLLSQLQQKMVTISELEKRVQEMRVTSLQSNGQLKYKVQEMERAMKVKDIRLQQYEDQINNLQKRISEQKSQHGNQTKTLISKTSQLTQQSHSRQRRISDLESELRNTQTLFEDTRRTLQSVSAEQITKSEEMVRTHRLHIEMKQKRISQLQLRNVQLSEEIKQVTANSQKSSHELNERQRSISALKQQLDTKKLHVDVITKKYSMDMGERDTLTNQRQSAIRQLESQVANLHPQLLRSQQQAKTTRHQNELLRKLLKDKDNQISASHSKLTATSQQMKQKLQKIQQLHQKLAIESSDHTKLKSKYSVEKQQYDSRVSSLVSQILRLQNQIQSINLQHGQELKKLQNDINTKASLCSKQQMDMIYLKHSETTLKKTIEGKESQINRYKQTIQLLRQDHVNRKEQSERKSVEQLMNLQQDRQRLQAQLDNVKVEKQSLLLLQTQKQKEILVQSSKINQLAAQNDFFRREITSLKGKNSESSSNYESRIIQFDLQRNNNNEELRRLRQQIIELESGFNIKEMELIVKNNHISGLDERTKSLEQTNKQLSAQLQTLKISVEETNNEVDQLKQEHIQIKKCLDKKEQQKKILGEALLREKKQNESFLANISSHSNNQINQEEILKQFQETTKDLDMQLQVNQKLRSSLQQTQSNLVKQTQHSFDLQNTIETLNVEFSIRDQTYNDKIAALKASTQAMEMIIQKLNGVHGDSQQFSSLEFERIISTLNGKINSLQGVLREQEQINGSLMEQLRLQQIVKEGLMTEKGEVDKETSEAVQSIKAQMQQLQEVSLKVLEKQQCDRQDYDYRIKEKEEYIGQLVETIQDLKETRSQQTSPQKLNDQAQFVRLDDYMIMLQEKEKEISKLKKLIDLQKRSESRSRAPTPRKLSMEGEEKSAASPIIQSAAFDVQPAAMQSLELAEINYEHIYKALLISLDLNEDESEESVSRHVQTLLSTSARYEKSVQDLMQKIDWMEQNLNILSQQNNDFHLELENKGNAAIELTKTIALRDKTIVQMRNYEAHLAKKLTKTEDMLEAANRAIINCELRLLSERHQYIEREEVFVLEKQGLQDRIRLMKSHLKLNTLSNKNQQTNEQPPAEQRQQEPRLSQSGEMQDSVIRSGIFHNRFDEDELLTNISFLSNVIRLKDNSHLERLYRSEEFQCIKQYFTQLAREDLSLTVSQAQSVE